MKTLLLIFLVSTLIACNESSTDATLLHDLITVSIIGSAESPDPELERVQALEQHGLIHDIVVMESFPVQTQLKASQPIIDELNLIPRKDDITYQ